MTHELDLILSDLVRYWQQQGIKVGPAASKSALRGFEARLHVTCPEDFVAYLLTTGGMPDLGDWDKDLIRFWPLAEIKPLDGVQAPLLDGFFIFADYSISAHEYGIRLSTPPHGEVALIHNPGFRILAPNFTEFLTLYLKDPMLLFQK
jgi:hypothetical protein